MVARQDVVPRAKLDLSAAVYYYQDGRGNAGYFSGQEMKDNDFSPDPVFCHGLHYAGGAFDGIRAVWDKNKKKLYVITLDAHLNRLVNSCHYRGFGGLNFKFDAEDIKHITFGLIAKNIRTGFLNPETGCYIRHLVYKDKNFDPDGVQIPGLGVYGREHPTVMTVSLFPWGAYLEHNPHIRVFEDGIASPSRRHKLCDNYGFGGQAKNVAKDHGFDEALITDVTLKRNVLEGGGENVFIVNGEEVITPGTDQDILPGTKRSVLIDMLSNYHIPVEERKIPLAEFMQADAAIFTGTAAGVIGIASVYEPKKNRSHQFNLEHRLRNGISIRTLEQQYQLLITGGRELDSVHRGLRERIRTPVGIYCL